MVERELLNGTVVTLKQNKEGEIAQVMSGLTIKEPQMLPHQDKPRPAGGYRGGRHYPHQRRSCRHHYGQGCRGDTRSRRGWPEDCGSLPSRGVGRGGARRGESRPRWGVKRPLWT